MRLQLTRLPSRTQLREHRDFLIDPVQNVDDVIYTYSKASCDSSINYAPFFAPLYHNLSLRTHISLQQLIHNNTSNMTIPVLSSRFYLHPSIETLQCLLISGVSTLFRRQHPETIMALTYRDDTLITYSCSYRKLGRSVYRGPLDAVSGSFSPPRALVQQRAGSSSKQGAPSKKDIYKPFRRTKYACFDDLCMYITLSLHVRYYIPPLDIFVKYVSKLLPVHFPSWHQIIGAEQAQRQLSKTSAKQQPAEHGTRRAAKDQSIHIDSLVRRGSGTFSSPEKMHTSTAFAVVARGSSSTISSKAPRSSIPSHVLVHYGDEGMQELQEHLQKQTSVERCHPTVNTPARLSLYTEVPFAAQLPSSTVAGCAEHIFETIQIPDTSLSRLDSESISTTSDNNPCAEEDSANFIYAVNEDIVKHNNSNTCTNMQSPVNNSNSPDRISLHRLFEGHNSENSICQRPTINLGTSLSGDTQLEDSVIALRHTKTPIAQLHVSSTLTIDTPSKNEYPLETSKSPGIHFRPYALLKLDPHTGDKNAAFPTDMDVYCSNTALNVTRTVSEKSVGTPVAVHFTDISKHSTPLRYYKTSAHVVPKTTDNVKRETNHLLAFSARKKRPNTSQRKVSTSLVRPDSSAEQSLNPLAPVKQYVTVGDYVAHNRHGATSNPSTPLMHPPGHAVHSGLPKNGTVHAPNIPEEHANVLIFDKKRLNLKESRQAPRNRQNDMSDVSEAVYICKSLNGRRSGLVYTMWQRPLYHSKQAIERACMGSAGARIAAPFSSRVSTGYHCTRGYARQGPNLDKGGDKHIKPSGIKSATMRPREEPRCDIKPTFFVKAQCINVFE